MNIFSYIRVSGLGQVDKDGPERQRIAIKAFCEKHCLNVAAEFFEQGVSGTVEAMDRPAFADMLIKANTFNQAGEPALRIDAIVVENVDRLARDAMVSELLFRECRSFGIKVFCANSDLTDVATNDGDPTRKLMRQILGAIAEWEKTMLVRKMASARIRYKKVNGRCEGRKPYGTHPKEKEILDLIDKQLALPASYSSIAAYLNSAGLLTRMCKPWTKSSVLDVVTKRNQKTRIKYARSLQSVS
jgi:DNA invertase Pin-like site-specific DNA recombinase